MISKIIHDYLKCDKRITIPGFGSFIRKENGQIAFVEILRGDDGVLSELVRRHGDYTEVEAAATIDRFIFEIKHALQTRGSIHIKGLGTMSLKQGGKIDFRSDAAPDNAAAEIPAAAKVETPVQRPTVEKKETVVRNPAAAPARRSVQTRKKRPVNKKRTDTLLIAAIIMAVIALSVMIYGFSVSGAPELRLIP